MGSDGTPATERIRTELEATRQAYHELLRAIPNEMWDHKSGNRDLLVHEVMWHMAWAMRWLAQGVADTRSGKRSIARWIPRAMADPARKIAMRLLARRATPESASRTYDAGHDELLVQLNALQDGDWALSSERFGEARTVAWHFQQPVEHFKEHAVDVRVVLEGAT